MGGKAVVLLSGGLDSAVVLAQAIEDGREVIALFVDYGQRCKNEYKMFKKLVRYYGKRGKVIPKKCTLRAPIESELTDKSRKVSNHKAVAGSYVPCRNSILLSLAFSVAESYDCEEVWIGTTWTARSEKGTPDATEDFLKSFELTMLLGSRVRFKNIFGMHLVAPLADLSKSGVIDLGLKLRAPFELTWSCLTEKDTPCGACSNCVERAKGFRQNKSLDPLFAHR